MKKQKKTLKKSSPAIIKEIRKERRRPKKEMFSFRLNPKLVRKFKEKCALEGIKPGETLSKLLKEFLSA